MSKGALTAEFFGCGDVEVEGNEATATSVCDASQSAPTAAAPSGVSGGPSTPRI